MGHGGDSQIAIKTIQLFARIYEGADLYHEMNLLSGARSDASGAHFQNRAGFTPTCYSSLPYTFPKISSIVNPLQCLFAPAVQKGMEREKIFIRGRLFHIAGPVSVSVESERPRIFK